MTASFSVAPDPDLRPRALAALAPPVLAGEAACGWFVRLAFAHRLTVHELAQQTKVSPWTLAAGGADLTRLVALADTRIATFTDGPHIPTSLTVRRAPNAGWAVCRACLDDDVASGRPPHIRRAWSHPLAGYCLVHDQPLVAHTPADPFGQAFADALDQPPRGDWRHLADVDRFERRALRSLACRLERPATGTLRKRTAEIADVVGALALNADYAIWGGVLDNAQRLWCLPPVRARAQRLDSELLFALDAADRLVFVRAALRILANPSKDLARRGSWLDRYLRLRGFKPERLRLGRVSGDPLLWLALQLTSHDAADLTQAAGSWRPALGLRWGAALATRRRILERPDAAA